MLPEDSPPPSAQLPPAPIQRQEPVWKRMQRYRRESDEKRLNRHQEHVQAAFTSQRAVAASRAAEEQRRARTARATQTINARRIEHGRDREALRVPAAQKSHHEAPTALEAAVAEYRQAQRRPPPQQPLRPTRAPSPTSSIAVTVGSAHDPDSHHQPPVSPSPTVSSASSSRPRAVYPPPTITRAAQPTRIFFDPYNTVSTGHQRAENRLSGSTAWRDSRARKLQAQFGAGVKGGGGERLYDTVGAGSEFFGEDGRKENGGWEKGAMGLRDRDQPSIMEGFERRARRADGPLRSPSKASSIGAESVQSIQLLDASARIQTPSIASATPQPEDSDSPSVRNPSTEPPAHPRVFAGTCIYINGSTLPTISDHKLRQLLVSHGASLSLALARKSITHVIIGKAASTGGCGGGLAGGKLQKETGAGRQKGVKFVGVEWVVQSVRAGKRLPEAGFRVVEMGGTGQKSVRDVFGGGGGGGRTDEGLRGT